LGQNIDFQPDYVESLDENEGGNEADPENEELSFVELFGQINLGQIEDFNWDENEEHALERLGNLGYIIFSKTTRYTCSRQAMSGPVCIFFLFSVNDSFNDATVAPEYVDVEYLQEPNSEGEIEDDPEAGDTNLGQNIDLQPEYVECLDQNEGENETDPEIEDYSLVELFG
jgi:hypothetical protein